MPNPTRNNEAKRLEALHRYQLLDTPSEQLFDDFAFLAAYICGTPIAAVTLIDANRQWFKAKVGLEVSETPRDQAFCAYTILGKQVMVVEDARVDSRFSKNPLVTSDPNIRFYAGAPLFDSNGFGLGSLCVIDTKPRQLAAEQHRALEALARQVVAQCEFRRISADLAAAVADSKILRGLLPICSHCKNIRDDEGYWRDVETHIASHSEADFSAGICPKCMELHHPELYKILVAEGEIVPPNPQT
jgi:GAF domain-containing protein